MSGEFHYVTRVVNASLDDVIQGEATGCLLVPQLAVHVLAQDLGHVVVVLREVRELLLNFVVEFEVVVCVSKRHDFFLTLRRQQQTMFKKQLKIRPPPSVLSFQTINL